VIQPPASPASISQRSAIARRIEIEAEIPEGAPDNLVRIVTENSQALKFGSHGFEEE